MRRLRPLVAITSLALASACHSATTNSFVATPSPYIATHCPVPDGMVGYPVTVTVSDTTVAQKWLNEWAQIAAQRWQVPSQRRRGLPGYQNVQKRIVPDVPRWADDWRPSAGDVAELEITIGREGNAVGPVVVKRASGDKMFDESLHTIFEDPLPASPAFPPISAVVRDSVRAIVRFGIEPPAGEHVGIIRFAREQTPVGGGTSGGHRLASFRTTRAVVKFDVNESGEVVPSSVEILGMPTRQFADEVLDGLNRIHTVPAQTDCRDVAITVLEAVGD